MNIPDHQSLFDLVQTRSRAALILGGGLALLCAVLFLTFPELDIATSRLFFDATPNAQGQVTGFWLNQNQVLHVLFKAVDLIARIVLVVAIGLLIVRSFRKHARLLPTAIVTFGLILGPGVLVNSVFKDHWDRARPRQIQEFGGDKQFTPAWIVSNQCQSNCSFTSGHAAAGFAFVVMHFVARSRAWLWLGVACGTLIGGARVAVGAHFLSDIVFSFFLVFLVAALVARILVRISAVSARAIRA
ncbi:MAG: phosphatase PAP2 family protein [Burkholderiaceae bacterium]|nr:phosphatase PAP2 family protein [Burkholderiaceae bacterium]